MNNSELHSAAIEVNILTTVMNKMARADIERRLGDTDVSSALQYAILRMLGHHEYTISEMSRMMQLEPATLIPSVDALERKGLAKRKQDPHDRRRNLLSITGAGNAALTRIPVADDADSLVQGLRMLGHGKCLQLLDLLRELMEYIADDPAMVQHISSNVRMQVSKDEVAKAN
jgi:DNA-binding MarR family transcriptional regulator